MEILYIEDKSSCPYVWSESSTLKNLASLCGIGDFPEYLGQVRNCAYREDSEYKPFIELLDSTGIEYTIVYKEPLWFESKEVW